MPPLHYILSHDKIINKELNEFKFDDTIVELDLSNKKIKLLSREFLADVPNLTHLNLSDNLLHQLPNTIFRTNLISFDVSGNFYMDFPYNFYHFKYIQYLYMKNMGLTELSKMIYKLRKSLIHLDLSDNKLTNLPEQIYRMKKLKTLNLSNNPIELITLQEIQNLIHPCKIIWDWDLYDRKEKRNMIIKVNENKEFQKIGYNPNKKR
jgi:Leucine-rich repeat (LRR) protein